VVRLGAVDAELLDYTRRLIRHRLAHPVFRRRRCFEGAAIRGSDPDIAWFTPQGTEMSEQDWQAGFAKSLCIFLNGQAIRSPGPKGEQTVDRSFLLLFNAHHEPVEFHLPARCGRDWRKVLDTAVLTSQAELEDSQVGDAVTVAGRAVVMLEEADKASG
jgi:isoamylase